MDFFGVLYVPNFLLCTVILLISLYFYGRRNYAYFTEIGIIGPKPTAFLGNLRKINELSFAEIFIEWKKEFGDIYGIFFGFLPILVVSDPEVAGEITVKRFSNFTNRITAFAAEEYTTNMLTQAEDTHWKYLRTVLAPSFNSRSMREMVPLIDNVLKIFDKKLNNIADSKEAADVSVLFSGFTMDVIASTGFGITVDSLENPDSPVVRNAKRVFGDDFFKSFQAIGFIFPIVTQIMSKVKPSLLLGGMSYFVGFCGELVKERKNQKDTTARKDLLQLMLDAQLEGNEKLDKKAEEKLNLENITDWRTKRGLTDVEIIAQCMMVFLAGFETTATTLSFFAHSIAMNPDIQEKIHQEIQEQLGEESPDYDNIQKLTYLDMCLEETMRIYPVAMILTRESREDCVIKGIKIPKNTAIFIPMQCLHYDLRYWNEPEKFDPERFSKENKAKQTPFTYMPFGVGPRICAGMRLVDLEMKMAIVHMLRKFRLVACDKTQVKMEYSRGGLLMAKGGIWLKIERR